MRNPASLKVCALLTKPAQRLVEVPLAYVGFEVTDEFVAGYGMDYAERYRDLPFIGSLRPRVSAEAPANAPPSVSAAAVER